MFVTIIIALVLAKIKKFKLKPLLKAYSLYPFAVLTILVIYLQVCVFLHNYTWIQYAGYVQTAHLITLMIPFLYYKLYKPGFFSAALIIAGTLLNKLVMSQNGGKMPVYATLSMLTGYFDPSILGQYDTVHSVGDASTKLKFLTDFIDLGYCVLSIGDVFIHSFEVIILYYVIKELNHREAATTAKIISGDV